ncbi:MAG: UdgX family uracil-DNA binding protein [Pseudomonadota bacterium]|nr:UdgX family uracil-DNA binding protein [Pseudomonadota bacterium]
MQLELASETDFEGFRRAARSLLSEGSAPNAVQWRVAGSTTPELALEASGPLAKAAPSATVKVPPDFIALCREVVLHADSTRFDLLYRLLWRLQHEPGLRHDAVDPQLLQARQMAQAVRRDMHKMKAFVRFRELPPANGEAVLHVAWFEPEHHIVEAVAPFFVRRFTAMRFAILTPERCVRWDGEQLAYSPGAKREDAPPADAGEALWLTYYQSIFNPARLKLRAMEKEMPRKYWHNLPEATLISGLAAQSSKRTGTMIEDEPTAPRALSPVMAAHRTSAIQPAASPAAPPPDATATERLQAWQSQRNAAAGCRECPIGALATQTVWGEGPMNAAVMMVGEQPGDQEDLRGEPFVGPSGQLLNRAMAQLGWDRATVYVTNAVKHFKYEPRGKRRMHKTAAQKEADACLHWLEAEIELVQPQAIVALGATAARQLMGRPVAVTRERGHWLQRADGRKVLITLHPSALLRTDAVERDAAYAAWLADLALAAPEVT